MAEARLLDVSINGSLRVHADSVMGHIETVPLPANLDDDGSCWTKLPSAANSGASSKTQQLLRYSSRCGRIKMVNVAVVNAGIDWSAKSNVYWKHQVARKESCTITLHGRGEFEAHNVTIRGDVAFVVPDGHRLVVTQGADGGLAQALIPLDPVLPSWEWKYSADDAGTVRLTYASYAMQQPIGAVPAAQQVLQPQQQPQQQ